MKALEEHIELMMELHRALLRDEFNKRTRDTLAALLEGLCNLKTEEELRALNEMMKVR